MAKNIEKPGVPQMIFSSFFLGNWKIDLSGPKIGATGSQSQGVPIFLPPPEIGGLGVPICLPPPEIWGLGVPIFLPPP